MLLFFYTGLGGGNNKLSQAKIGTDQPIAFFFFFSVAGMGL